MRLYDNVAELVGRTPMVRLRTGIPEPGPQAYVKLEFFNPTGSVKDRMTLHIVRKALAEGRLKPQLERSYPIEDAAAAFEALASNEVRGKLVLVVDPALD